MIDKKERVETLIISASRRTDIPAFYSDWFYKRIQEGYVMVRNPMNIHQISKVSLSREVVDCIVFWTKNPEKMMSKLYLIDEYAYYFQFTLNPYDSRIETRVPKKARIIDIFKKLSDKIGPQRVIWRYDPILITHHINEEYHVKYFEILASKLHNYTTKCVISFVDFYSKAQRNLKNLGAYEIRDQDKIRIALKLDEIAKAYSLKLETCAEDLDLSEYGIEHSKCIDPDLIGNLLGVKFKTEKDKNQRKLCGCAASVDIGAYNTCGHACLYCYANYSGNAVNRNMAGYNPDFPLLCSRLTSEDVISEKNAASCAVLQKSLFD